MPSPDASRRNLKRAQNPCTESSHDESALIWKLTLDWWTEGERREPKNQKEWARVLEVTQPYVAKMVCRFKRELREGNPKWYDRILSWAPAALEDLRRAREVRKRVRARLAEERLWEQYDAEQRREQSGEDGGDHEEEYAECSDEEGMEQQPAPDDEGWEPHPDPQLRGLVWVPRRRRR